VCLLYCKLTVFFLVISALILFLTVCLFSVAVPPCCNKVLQSLRNTITSYFFIAWSQNFDNIMFVNRVSANTKVPATLPSYTTVENPLMPQPIKSNFQHYARITLRTTGQWNCTVRPQMFSTAAEYIAFCTHECSLIISGRPILPSPLVHTFLVYISL